MSSQMRHASLSTFSVKLDEKGHKASVKLPPLSADDFDMRARGRVPIWRVLHWNTMARIAAFNAEPSGGGSTFLDYNNMTADKFTFYVSNRMTVSRDFHALLRSATSTSVFPVLSIEFHVGYIGISSLNTVGLLLNNATGSELARLVNQVALISKQTRKPVPVPEDWMQKYSTAVVENERLVIPVVKVPTDVDIFRYNIQVRWSDTDSYKHTNYLSYVRFCFDAAQEAVSTGWLSSFEGDIVLYDVKAIQMLYKAESRVNDLLTVLLWPSKTNSHELNFSLEKANGQVVYQCCVEFYPQAVEVVASSARAYGTERDLVDFKPGETQF